MNTYTVMFSSGHTKYFKADECDIRSNYEFKEAVFRVKGWGIVARVNLNFVESIEVEKEKNDE